MYYCFLVYAVQNSYKIKYQCAICLTDSVFRMAHQ